MHKRRLLVLASDTNAGKTWLCCELLKRAREEKFCLLPYKPLATGDRSDALLLAAASNSPYGHDFISPVFFQAPMAPYAASLLENTPIHWSKIELHLQQIEKNSDAILIETAGGLLTPCDHSTDMIDLVFRWSARPIVVVPNKLGSITQCRSALEILLQRKILPLAVVLNNIPLIGQDKTPCNGDILQAIRQTNFALLSSYYPGIPLYDTTTNALNELWNHLKVHLTESV